MKLEWSAAALADLDRFAAFLHDRHPSLAGIVGAEIKRKAQILSETYSIWASHHAPRFPQSRAAGVGAAMLTKVTALEKLGGYRLRVRFNDGSGGIRDFATMVEEPGSMLRAAAG